MRLVRNRHQGGTKRRFGVPGRNDDGNKRIAGGGGLRRHYEITGRLGTATPAKPLMVIATARSRVIKRLASATCLAGVSRTGFAQR